MPTCLNKMCLEMNVCVHYSLVENAQSTDVAVYLSKPQD